jgi:transcriptional regulator with PAS, ATPase and Fis domain
MPFNTQVKLLRVLEEKRFEPVGDSNSVKVDIRVIASTNSPLLEKVDKGEFRKDLYYRLKVLEINLPPLRKRREDIPLLVDFFLSLYREQIQKPIESVSETALQSLMAYPWPGNIRELKHAMEHAFIVCHENRIQRKDLPLEIQNFMEGAQREAAKSKAIHSQTISQEIRASEGNISKAARRLGISRQTIYRRMKKEKG